MSDTVTAYYSPTGRNGQLVPVVFSVSHLTELWHNPTVRIKDIADEHHCSVNAVRKAARSAGLLDRSQVQTYAPIRSTVDLDKLRFLVVDQKLGFGKAAKVLGTSAYVVRQLVGENKIPSKTLEETQQRHDCLTCENLNHCKRIEPTGALLACESKTKSDIPLYLTERDAAPSYSNSEGLPYCALSHK